MATDTAQAEWDKRRADAREAAHQAVKAFDRSPDITTSTEAIFALSAFAQVLREGRPVSHDERRSFEQRWDAVVEGQKPAACRIKPSIMAPGAKVEAPKR